MKLATARDYLSDELRQLEGRLLGIIADDFELFNTMVARLVAAGGKRLRAILVLLAAKSGEGWAERSRIAVEVAAVCELVHLATLIHDDVIDQAAVRRGVPTIHTELGNQITVLMGDHLYARSIRHLITATGRADLVKVLADAVARLCEGEIRQLNETLMLGHIAKSVEGEKLTQNFEPRKREYLAVIARKTADFFGACGEMGAMLTGDGNLGELLREYGFNLGMAFQITDDLLDYGIGEVTGKDEGNDLVTGRLTLSLIHGLHHDEHGRELLALLSLSGDNLRKEIAELLDRAGSLKYAKAVARQYADRALAVAEEHPHPEIGPILRDLAGEVMDRRA